LEQISDLIIGTEAGPLHRRGLGAICFVTVLSLAALCRTPWCPSWRRWCRLIQR
jgi:hypothetical protein